MSSSGIPSELRRETNVWRGSRGTQEFVTGRKSDCYHRCYHRYHEVVAVAALNIRDPAPAPPARRPATAASAPPGPELGGPGTARGPAQRDTESAAPGPGCWSPRTRSCAGTATSSGAARPPGPSGAAPAARPSAGTSRPWSSGWLGKTPAEDTAGSTASCPAWESTSRRRPYGRSSRSTASTPRRGGPGRPGHSSCAPTPRRSWPATSSALTCPAAPRPMS